MVNMEELKKVVEKEYNEGFFGLHVQKVVEKAEWLLDFYPEADRDIVVPACYLHDIVHTTSGYKGDDHNIASARKAREIISEFSISEDKIDRIVSCIESHRSSRPPEPETIEARIVASADNLSHFDNYESLVRLRNKAWADRKLERDASKGFMLPEAIEYCKEKRPHIFE